MTHDADNITTKFQKNIVATLQPISPQLAALHASRYRLLNLSSDIDTGQLQDIDGTSLFSPLHCSRCGWLALSVRIVDRFARGSNKSASSRRKRKRRVNAVEAPIYADTTSEPLPSSTSTSTTRRKRISIRSTCNACGYVDFKPVNINVDGRVSNSMISASLEKASSAVSVTGSNPLSLEKDINSNSNSNLNYLLLVHNPTASATGSTPVRDVVTPSEIQKKSKKKNTSASTYGSTSTSNNQQLHHLLAKQKQRDRERGGGQAPAQGSLAAFLNELG